MMTIKEMIEKLKEFPEDYEVCPCVCAEEMLVTDHEGNQHKFKVY